MDIAIVDQRRKSQYSRNSIKSEGSTTQLKRKTTKLKPSQNQKDQLPYVYEQSLTSNIQLIQSGTKPAGNQSKLSKQRSITKISKNAKNSKKTRLDKSPSFVKSPTLQLNQPQKSTKVSRNPPIFTDEMMKRNLFLAENSPQISIYNSQTRIDGIDSPNITKKQLG